VSGAIGIDMDQTVAFQAFAFVMGLLAVSDDLGGFLPWQILRAPRLPRFGQRGEILHVSVQVRKLAGRARRDLELLEDLADPRPSLSEFATLLAGTQPGRRFSHGADLAALPEPARGQCEASGVARTDDPR